MRIENQMCHPDHEDLVAIFIELQEHSWDHPIIVEGIRDTESLNGLGIRSEILHINQGVPLIEFCARISRSHSKVILLTDWDPKGNYLCKILKRDLKACDVQFDIRIRDRITTILRNDVKDVQGILPFLDHQHPGTLETIRNELADLRRTMIMTTEERNIDTNHDRENETHDELYPNTVDPIVPGTQEVGI